MLNIIRGILQTFCILLVVDTIYLMGLKDMFGNAIKNIQKSDMIIRIYSALLCYLCLATIIYYFIIFKKESITTSAILGALVYGVFDFTNHAIFQNWTLSLAIMDIVWGAILFAGVTYIVKLF
jgi:uncharacterized membrane protein